MRLVISIVLSIGIAFFFGLTAQANDLVGGQAKPLSSHALNSESLEKLKQICDSRGSFITPTKSACLKASAIPLSQLAFDYCIDHAPKNLNNSVQTTAIMECFDELGHNDYSLEYLKACEKTIDKSNNIGPYSSKKICLQYLANTKSSFESEAFDLCFKAAGYNFRSAKPCLNSIRDRQVDTQKLNRECMDDGRVHEKTIACIDKLADASPLALNCSKPAISSPNFKGAR